RVFTCGTTIPIVPRSSARMMIPWSLLFTRVTEVMPHRSQARDISPICSQLSGPCSPSNQTPSKPNCPRKSIMSVLACPDTTVTGCPSCNFRLIRFSRIQVLLCAPCRPLAPLLVGHAPVQYAAVARLLVLVVAHHHLCLFEQAAFHVVRCVQVISRFTTRSTRHDEQSRACAMHHAPIVALFTKRGWSQ